MQMQNVTNRQSADKFKSGAIPVSGIAYMGCNGAPMPMTLYLTSTAGNREIAISTDGVNYVVPGYDFSPASFISVAILAPIASVRFTGAQNDAWGIR